MKRSRWIIITALVTAAVLSIAYGFVARRVTVDVATVSRAPLIVTVEEEGKTRVKDRFVISAPVAGFLRRITLDAGDTVQKGQVVAHLEPLRSTVLDPRSRAEAEAELSAAEAAVRAARENLSAAEAAAAYAAANHGRTVKLFEAGYEARDALEQAESEAKRTEAVRLSAEASLGVARSRLARAESTLGYSAAEGVADHRRVVPVVSPVRGTVLKIYRESEGVVNAAEPLMDVGDPSRLEVEVEVLSADAVNIRQGTAVVFERWGGEPALTGEVTVVEPGGFTKISSLGVEEQRVLVIADITSPAATWRKLADRYRVEASFIIWQGDKVLQIPASALFRYGQGWAVFAVEGGRARLRQVELEHRTGLAAEIISGLDEGMSVIVHPDDTVEEGTRVKVRKP